MKNITKKLELLALAIGLGASATITFFLLNYPAKCIIPFEPILWIRIPEIILGLFSIIFLIKIINEKI